MNIKKSPLMAGLLALSSVFGARAYEGEIDVKSGCFDNAPIDKVLGVSNGFVMTYRSQAKYTSLTTGQKQIGWDMNQNPLYETVNNVVVTNSAPFVRVSLDGKQGFASGKGVLGANAGSLVNEQTGVVATADEDGNVFINTPNGNALGGFTTTTNKVYAQEHATSPAKLKSPVAYMYDENNIIILGINTGNTAIGSVTRAVKSGDRFVVTKQNGREHAPYFPTMATQSDDKVYFSDGNGIISYDAKNTSDATRTEVVSGTVKEMAVAGGKLFWTTGTELYCDGTPSVFNLNGAQMTGMVSDGTTLYVGNTNGTSYATSLGGVPVRYVDGAAKLISSQENGKTAIYKMTLQNQFERINN